MWFSYGWDLTNTLQRQKALEDAGMGPGQAPLWKRADERFFWNRFLQDRFISLTEKGTDVSLPQPQIRKIADRLAEPLHPPGYVWM